MSAKVSSVNAAKQAAHGRYMQPSHRTPSSPPLDISMQHSTNNIRTLPNPWGRPCASRSPSYVSHIAPSAAAGTSVKGAVAASAVHAASVHVRATFAAAANTDAYCPRANTKAEKHFIRVNTTGRRAEAEKHFIRDRVAWCVVRTAR
jgi:hypothetical protein